MSNPGYAVWRDSGLYHWSVDVERGLVRGHGAAIDLALARAEAIDFGLDPARAEEVALVRQRRREDALRRARDAYADACRRSAIADARIPDWTAGREATNLLLTRSKEAIAQSRWLLQVHLSNG